MRKLCLYLAAALLCAGCAKQLTPAEKEEARRASLELQSVMDMVARKELPPVEFEFGSWRLLQSSQPLLDRIAALMLQRPKLKLIVAGHTDDVGSEEANQLLSQKRAGEVKRYLCTKGVYPDSIRVRGYGESQPVLNEKTEAARALNRRVEFHITTRNWNSVF